MASKFSLYDTNPDVEKYVSEGVISVHQFVENISKDHNLKGAEVNNQAYLDPKPYIRSFESTLRELNKLSLDAKAHEARGEKEVDSFELKHSENVLGLSQQIADTTEKFNFLDGQISEVSSKINPLGSTLSKISTSRDKSQETIFLIRAYHGFFMKGAYPPLEALRTSTKIEENTKCAKSIKNLKKLASRISDESLPSTLKCLKAIEDYGQTMEEELLQTFEVLVEGGDEHSDGNVDIQRMNKIATILFEYNNGTNLIETFVSKHAISNSEDAEALEDLVSSNAESSTELETKLKGYFENLKFELKSKARISKKIFDDADMVLGLVLQRTFDQELKPLVTKLLSRATEFNTLRYLTLLNALKKMVYEFTDDIKDYVVIEDFNKDGSLLVTLDQACANLFQEYTRDEVYLAQEKKNIEEAVQATLNKLDFDAFSYYFSKSEPPVDYKSSDSEHSSFAHERKRLAHFKQYVMTKISERSQNERGISKLEIEEDELAAIEAIESLIKTVAESMGRVMEISPQRTPDHSLVALNLLISNFDKLSIREEVQLQGQDFFLNLYSIQFRNEIIFCLCTCAKMAIFPSLASSPAAKTKAKALINDFVKRHETSINELLQKTVEYILFQTQQLLNKQKKKDFLCDAIEEDTAACEAVNGFLEEMFANVTMALSGGNLETFLIAVGAGFLNQLLEHYKKFSVNSIGGIVLTRDVIQYQSRIDEWNIPALSEKFQILKEIGNLFTVQSSLVNSLVTEGQLSQMKPYTVRQYISQRADFNPSLTDRIFRFR
ncbi:uncharacterized protein LODBEIA_P52420 [Lodderomyces beijingensis]|uniref:Exocyst complex component Sec10 n=1 Tax=Lodderomyces beijingensis TaxID=1775926 RepID=A0ABP0ZSA4_9ASCO